MKGFKALLAIIVLSLVLTACSQGISGAGGTSKTLKAKSDELKNTAITAHLEKKIADGENIIYCSAFQLAWDELTDSIIKEEIKLEGNPDTAEKLNRRLTGKDDLSEEYYLAMAGYGQDDIVDKINDALKERFKGEAPEVKENLNPRDIMAYAFLYKNLEFKEVFEAVKDSVAFGDKEVYTFGITKNSENTKAMAEQVRVIDYKNPDDFIIKLLPKSGEDEIILAKVEPGTDLLSTLEGVERRIDGSEELFLGEDDTLRIPRFDFDITHDYKELIGRHLLNKDFQTYFAAKAMQNTKFKLNEKGAVLKSEAKIVLKECAPIEVRSLIFNKPFMLILKEKGADMPYFVMWVDNTELMVDGN